MKLRPGTGMVGLAALLAAANSGCAHKEVRVGGDGEPQPRHQEFALIGKYSVHRYLLDNGLRLLVVEDHASPTFAYHTWYKVGSRDEMPGKTGLAHLFEHMMFKGTQAHPEGELDRILESAGAEGENAFTSRDYTAYVQELPKDKLDLIAGLESDRMVNLVVNEQSFKTELQVVQNERRFRNENNPDGIMYQELFEVAFTKHPYHWPVIGYQKDLDSMTAKDALEFYKTYYSPNHATIIVVGDVDADEVFDTVEKYYGTLPAQPDPAHEIPADPAQTSPRRKQLKLNIQVEKLLLGYHVPGLMSDDIPVMDVLQSVLTGGNSSRLHRALVETGIASSVYAYDLEDKDPSLFVIGVSLQKGQHAAQAEAIVLRELQRLTKQPVPEQELQRAKNRLSFGFYDGLNSNSEKSRFLGHYEATVNDFRLGMKHLDRIPQITAAEVQAVVRRYFEPKGRTVITGVKK